MTQREKLYAKRDAVALDEAGNYYINHVMAMGSEQLHSKSAIASELAHRDMLIDKLTKELQAAKAQAVPQWIPVSERLPEYGEHVLMLIPTSINYVVAGFISCDEQEDEEGSFHTCSLCDQCGDDIGYSIECLSRWMPLPELPIPTKDGA